MRIITNLRVIIIGYPIGALTFLITARFTLNKFYAVSIICASDFIYIYIYVLLHCFSMLTLHIYAVTTP